MAAENITGTVYDIKMVVFKMDILFATNKTWADSLDDGVLKNASWEARSEKKSADIREMGPAAKKKMMIK
jgi:hypothetical protein